MGNLEFLNQFNIPFKSLNNFFFLIPQPIYRICYSLNNINEFLEIQLTEVYKVGSIEFSIGSILTFFLVLFS